jgi:pantetheine-phosphate adenylyltransferase
MRDGKTNASTASLILKWRCARGIPIAHGIRDPPLHFIGHPPFSLFPPPSSCKASSMRRAIYPGSFDPVTNGHIDVIQRASRLFDEVIVAVAYNDEKSPLFTSEERLHLLEQTVSTEGNVKVVQFQGLLVDFARNQGATAIVRGLRAISDFEFEFQMALMNRKLVDSVETIFLMPKEEYTYLSSRIVKEIARLGGNVEAFVPPFIAEALKSKLKQPAESAKP